MRSLRTTDLGVESADQGAEALGAQDQTMVPGYASSVLCPNNAMEPKLENGCLHA